MNRERRLLTMLLCLVTACGWAGESGSHKEAYQLMEYQYWHSTEHVVYLKLGNIFENLYPTEHPIRDYRELQIDLYNIKLFYGNCLHYAKDQTLKQDEYLQIPHAGKRTTYEELDKELRARIESAKDKQVRSTALYEAYYRLYAHYEQCRMLYTQFAETYPREKNAHLLLDEEHLNMLRRLSQMTDSVHADIEAYEQALNDYPIADYHPVFRWQDIRLYRIDGLTKTDLLQNDVALWNYQEWVQHFLEEQNTLYRDYYGAIHQELADNKSDKRLLNTIARLDYGSFLGTWFALRQGKRAMQAAGSAEVLTRTSEDYMEVVLPYVQAQSEQLRELAKREAEVKGAVKEDELRKYQNVLDEQGLGQIAEILSDAQQQVQEAEKAYGALCQTVIEQAEAKAEPFVKYTNEFTGENIDVALLTKLGVTEQGSVLAVIPIGYRYMAILDNHKIVHFDTEKVYADMPGFGEYGAVLTAYKMSSNTIAILMGNRIIFVDSMGRTK